MVCNIGLHIETRKSELVTKTQFLQIKNKDYLIFFCLFIFLWFLTIFLFLFLSMLMVIISLELTRVNPDRNIFSINLELTSTFLEGQKSGTEMPTCKLKLPKIMSVVHLIFFPISSFYSFFPFLSLFNFKLKSF